MTHPPTGINHPPAGINHDSRHISSPVSNKDEDSGEAEDSPPDQQAQQAWLLLENGQRISGRGFGHVGFTLGELVFNTGMTGYQEILTDPSYFGQLVLFTFPHIGNTGINREDDENFSSSKARPCKHTGAKGMIVRCMPGMASDRRAYTTLDAWLKHKKIIGLCDVNTRYLTHKIRDGGMVKAGLYFKPGAKPDFASLQKKITAWPGINHADFTAEVSSSAIRTLPFKKQGNTPDASKKAPRIAVIDLGVKKSILDSLSSLGCRLRVIPGLHATEYSFADADGVVLTNGPGDPAAIAQWITPVIEKLLKKKIPLLGVCMGHQLLALALGAKRVKMRYGHHGMNHPVFEKATSKTFIVPMNHGFAIDATTLPSEVKETHISLFDSSNCGIALRDAPAFSVQFHPEAHGGPQDTRYVFTRFLKLFDRQCASADIAER